MRAFLFLLSLLAATPCLATDQRHLFLLVGQSNMAGRGVLGAPAQETPLPRVFVWGKDGGWVPAVEPYHWDKPGAGAGLAKSFAETVTKSAPEISLGLIPAAVGGTPLAAWQPGALFTSSNCHPYDDALQRARAAMGSGQLKAILWHQGESDVVPHSSKTYEQRLRELITTFRRDLGDETLPFIIGQLGQFEERPWTDDYRRIDQANQNLANSMTNVWYVSADGLASKGDKLHFNTPALRELGVRYAKTYLQHQKNKDKPTP